MYIDLGHLSSGAAVRVDITGNAANVQLLDAVNYAHYKRRESYRYVGGPYTGSPAVLRTTHSGRWFVVGDLGGRTGRLGIKASVHT